MKKLAIITTHPIQYYAPVFRLLAKYLEIKVYYTLGDYSLNKFDHGFKQEIAWDIPLLDGYEYEFVKNTSKEPGTHHFKGIINPDINANLKKYSPNAILVYGWAYSAHLSILRHFSNQIPIYFRGDSVLLDSTDPLKKIFRKLLLTWVYSHVKKAFYVGTANKDYFNNFGLKEQQLFFAPHAIENERFLNEGIKDNIGIRQDIGLSDKDVLILFAGKFEQKKDPLLLLEAFFELNLPHVHLLFVGNGILESILKDQVKSREINRVYFMDFQNQSKMPTVYQACDLFCLPSKGPNETWGLAVNEAMAAGKAVLVSTVVGCASDLVKAGVNGEVFQPGNLNALKQKIEKLTSHKHELVQMGKASKEMIKNWSFEKQVKAIVDTINADKDAK
ncbi:glycosyltransferase [Pedobacter psychrodurus]|uniref:Glycosyltransferase n=1 Tax=Pedobacter psychrodurus TaxID=2530456 RepID=A0A4R0PZY7_9SPHI|nr:glycosyltransferase family 4 protein [Pedobacter psychrodurus]TCD28943.1 glycosyltransferase [Pedobacter psychrodurus]